MTRRRKWMYVGLYVVWVLSASFWALVLNIQTLTLIDTLRACNTTIIAATKERNKRHLRLVEATQHARVAEKAAQLGMKKATVSDMIHVILSPE